MRAAGLVVLVALGACQAPAAPQPAPARAFFEDVWAPRLENCRDFPWTIERGRLDAPGKVSCSWSRVEAMATGSVLHASCSAEGAVQPVEIEVDRAGPGRITLNAQVWHERVTLYACPSSPGRP